MPKAENTERCGSKSPTRMCVICRDRFPKDALLRHVAPATPRNAEKVGDPPQGEPVADIRATLPGRGFYLCRNEACRRKFKSYRGWRKTWKGVRGE